MNESVDPAVEEAALEWFLRCQGGDPDGDDRRALFAWRASDPAHDRAYAHVEAVWSSPDLVRALRKGERRFSFGMPAPAALMRMAASVALFALIAGAVLRISGIPIHMPADYAAYIGETQSAALSDGTRLVLDSGAAVDLAYSDSERRIDVRAGRAYFDVGTDRRPFRVAAGEVIIRDIGTRFSVERRGGEVLVAVEEGEVALRPVGETAEQHLKAGQVGGHGEGFLPKHVVPADISFGWLNNRLFFAEAPLGDVVDQLRRYHRGWIVIANPEIARVRVSGGYDMRDTVAATQDLARLSGASLTRVSDRILILR